MMIDTSRPGRGRPLAVAAAVAALLTACSSGSDDDVASGGGTDEANSTTVATVDAEPVASSGCGQSTATPGVEQEGTLTVEGQPRRYLVTTPTSHDGETPLPLVLDFHGLLEGAEIHSAMSQYSTLAEEEGFVAVFPHGTGEPVRWDADPSHDPNLDLLYLDALLAKVGDDLCLDESRVYATGLSYGSIFTSLLLCERAEVLAAVAPVAGLQDLEGCEPSRPVPIVTFHGTDDPILQFDGSVDMSAIPGFGPEAEGTTTTRPPPDLDGAGYPATVATWAERNGCDPEATDTELTPEIVHRVYDCPDGANVEFYIVVGGGHSWPASEFGKSVEAVVGPTTSDIDATRDGWAFLQQFRNERVSG